MKDFNLALFTSKEVVAYALREIETLSTAVNFRMSIAGRIHFVKSYKGWMGDRYVDALRSHAACVNAMVEASLMKNVIECDMKK